jgi:tetratricopeptide (TPR) repeat protein
VPTSFLFDAQRRLVAIYKGPVDASQIKADFSLLSATAEERLRAACPDPTGRWHAPIQSVGILSSVSLLLEEGFKEAAEKLTESTILYYNQPLPPDAPLDQVAWHRQEFASAQKLLAMWDLERKDYAKAEKRYLISLQAMPTLATRRDLAKLYSGLKDPKLYPHLEAQLEEITKTDPNPEELAKLGVLKLEMGKPTEAIALLKSSLEKEPEAINWFQLAQAHRATGAAADARKAWENALKLQPEFFPALNNLAWLLATHPDKSLRDGTTALKLAKKAVELTSGTPRHSRNSRRRPSGNRRLFHRSKNRKSRKTGSGGRQGHPVGRKTLQIGRTIHQKRTSQGVNLDPPPAGSLGSAPLVFSGMFANHEGKLCGVFQGKVSAEAAFDPVQRPARRPIFRRGKFRQPSAGRS